MMNLRVWNRRLHRIGAACIALPFLLVIATGLLLQLKKQVPWIQPPELRGEGPSPMLSLPEMLEKVRAVPGAGISTWDDVDRVDVRPGKGIVKVVGHSRWEVQLDAATGVVLQTAFRRSDLIESLHDGSFFHPVVKLWVFFPAGLIVLGLWITGVYLFLLPYGVRLKRKK